MNGALQANGSLRFDACWQNDVQSALRAHHDLDPARRENRFLVRAQQTLLPDLVERLGREG